MVFLIVTIDIFLFTIRESVYLMLYVTISLAVVVLAGTFFDFSKEKKLFDDIESRLENLDKKYLVVEVLDKYDSQEGEHIREILKDMEMSMSDNVSAYRRNNEEYKDYIETWVHEIKIPISTAKMIMENHKELAVGQSGIDTEIDRIENHVEQALFYSRSAAVERDYFIRDINLEDIVKEVITKRKKTLISMKAVVDIHDMETRSAVKSDGKWIAFIIGQIIDNSVKYAKEDERLVLSIDLSDEDEHVCLNIRDNGVGMKSSEVGRAFDKGFTGSNGRAGKASTGIGLYLCKKLCKRLQHTIRIESEEGIGTTVSIIF